MEEHPLIIECRQVFKKLRLKTILKDISIQVPKGAICGFIGPNGAGKTTLIRLICGLITPHQGEIYIDGIDLVKNRKMGLQKIGAIVEYPIFFPYMTGRKMLRNLARLHYNLSKTEQYDQVESALKITGLEECADDRIDTYSLGTKQRLGIAQALLGKPELIVLDEPTNGLDPIGIRNLREIVIALKREKGISFFISSHHLSEIEQICDWFIFINKGSIVCEGPKENVLSDHSKNLEDIYMEMIHG